MRILIAAALLALALGFTEVNGKLEGSVRTRLESDPTSTNVILTGTNGKFKSFVQPNGIFRIPGVPDGTYVLETTDLKNFYEPVIVEVNGSKDKGKVKAFLYDIRNGKGPRLANPMTLTPKSPMTYFEVKEGINPMAFLKSPFGIMISVSVVMYFLMQKMPKPDKEMMDDMNKQMGGMKLPGFMNPPAKN